MSQSFSHERYNEIIEQTIAEIKKLGTLKGGEYAGDQDRLANFRRNGENLGLPMETIWAVYAGKHWDAVMQYIKDQRSGKERERLEPIESRVDDLLVYMILFKCMLDERNPEVPNIPEATVSREHWKLTNYSDPRQAPDYSVGPVGETSK